MTNIKNNTNALNTIGLGNIKATIRIYIENTPPLPQYQELTTVKPLNVDDVFTIGKLTGNHWRKIFNIFAKLLFEYQPLHFMNWQLLRDEYLLQDESNEALLFSPTSFDEIKSFKSHVKTPQLITIIMGKTYARKLDIDKHCFWLNEHFAVNTNYNIIICPYFDYRQLSNIKITQLVQLIKQLKAQVN